MSQTSLVSSTALPIFTAAFFDINRSWPRTFPIAAQVTRILNHALPVCARQCLTAVPGDSTCGAQETIRSVEP